MIDFFEMDLSCAILAGGKSRRMGYDKATLDILGTSLINLVYTTVRDIFQEIFIVSSNHENFEGIDTPVIKDAFPLEGPFIGIYSALLYARNEYVFCLGCDMPFIEKKAIEYMIGEIHGEDIIIPRTRYGYEPLHTIYRKTCIPGFERSIKEKRFNSIKEKRFKIINIFNGLEVRELYEHPCFFNGRYPVFTNINTDKDLKDVYDYLVTKKVTTGLVVSQQEKKTCYKH
ncbi:MAG TPA: hypothetical protein DDW17_04335 [Deltaproteobacteria bacterium]|nr:hypothetical protein [Deltaproteobacteria bacterium]